jgi:hypothetical protein
MFFVSHRIVVRYRKTGHQYHTDSRRRSNTSCEFFSFFFSSFNLYLYCFQFKGGHPGTVMGAAAIGVALWRHLMCFNPKNPDWYSIINLAFYKINFSQVQSRSFCLERGTCVPLAIYPSPPHRLRGMDHGRSPPISQSTVRSAFYSYLL